MPGWPKKLHISIWDHITLRRLMTERHVICQKFQKLSRMKCIICILVQLNILCLICINRQYPKIALNLPMTHEFCSICFRNAVKQGRSLTHVVSPDKIHIRSKSEWGVSCLPNDCWGEENISCKALWFLSLFQNLLNAETDLVFVQSDAKINKCLLLWEHTRTRFIAGNLLYLEQQLRGSPGHSACTPFTPHCSVSEWVCSFLKQAMNRDECVVS